MIEYINTHEQSPSSETDYWCTGTIGMLIFTPYASRKLRKFIGWKRFDFPENRKEQGGILIGRYIKNKFGETIQAEVTEVLKAETDSRFSGYIEWDTEEFRLQEEFFNMQDALAKEDEEAAKELVLIGWWHTHPNGLPVFMSGTDLETQRLKYFRPDKYAVVLNPHTGVWKAFAGADAVEVPAIMLMDGEKKAAVASHIPASHVPFSQLLDNSKKKKRRNRNRKKKKSNKKGKR